MKLVWDESAWDDYVWWQQQDRKVLKRINTLITDIQRNGNEGIGKPEPLKHGFQGYWSRRITDEHRFVYKVIDDEIRIAACRYHYERLPKPYNACGVTLSYMTWACQRATARAFTDIFAAPARMRLTYQHRGVQSISRHASNPSRVPLNGHYMDHGSDS